MMAKCTAKATGIHRTDSGKQRCPVHRDLTLAPGTCGAGAATAITPAQSPAAQTPLPLRSSASQDQRLSRLSEEVLELMMAQKDKELLKAAVEKLLDAATPQGVPRKAGRTHEVCGFFEEVAIVLQKLMGAASTAVDKLVGATLNESPVLAVAVEFLLKRVVGSGAETALGPVHFKACVCALLTCPEPSKHDSLDHNCMPYLGRVLSDVALDGADSQPPA